MALTPKQEAFCQFVASGMNQSAAYRSAYDAENMAAKTVTEKASVLASEDNISARVSELKAALQEKQLWSRQDSVRALKSIVDGAGVESKPNEVVAAIKELNVMHGFNAPTKVEITGEVSVIERRIVDPKR